MKGDHVTEQITKDNGGLEKIEVKMDFGSSRIEVKAYFWIAYIATLFWIPKWDVALKTWLIIPHGVIIAPISCDMVCLNPKFGMFIQNSLKFVSEKPIIKYVNIGPSNGSVPNRRQALVWANVFEDIWHEQRPLRRSFQMPFLYVNCCVFCFGEVWSLWFIHNRLDQGWGFLKFFSLIFQYRNFLNGKIHPFESISCENFILNR